MFPIFPLLQPPVHSAENRIAALAVIHLTGTENLNSHPSQSGSDVQTFLRIPREANETTLRGNYQFSYVVGSALALDCIGDPVIGTVAIS